jgi:intracellular multiplication protein IcmC
MADCSGGGFKDWISCHVDILTNIASNLAPFQRLISGAAYLIGLSFAMKALFCLKSLGESRTMMSGDKSMKEPLVYLFVAAMLIYLPTGFQIVMNSTFGPNSRVLAYSDNNQTMGALFGENSAAGAAVTLIIQTIGLISFIRGWVLIAKSASQGQPPGATGKGLVHVFGGILAMNIVGTLDIINNTIYGSS